jgi:hypothetical protein
MGPAIRLLGLCVAFFAPTFPLSAQAPTPASVIENLYARYGIGADGGGSGLNEKAAAQFFDASLLKLYRTAFKAGVIDSDFFIQGQDFALKKPIEITDATVTGDKARVFATLTQDDESDGKPIVRQNKFVFILARDGGAWRVDDALSEGRSFRGELAADIKGGK